MNSPSVPQTLRRSSRVPFTLPILVTSMEPSLHFSELCETLVVNAHGCAVRSPVQLRVGVPINFHNQEGRQTTAYVVDCQPLGADRKSWMVGARLDKPDNFWGLQPCPDDWMRLPQNGKAMSADLKAIRKQQITGEAGLKVVAHKGQELSESQVRTLIGEILQPLHAEVIELRQKVAHPEKRSSFEVSLSQIPPELEEKLWLRLRQELGAQVMAYAGEQAEQVLVSAKSAIEQNIATAQNEFQQQVTQELQMVQVRAQRLSDDIDDGVREQIRAGLESFQQHEVQAGTRLEKHSDEFYQSLQRRLNQENDVRLREIEQIQAAINSESSQLQALIGDLSDRANKLDEYTRRLESELSGRLAQLSGEVVSGARAQLESHVETILSEMQTRSAKELGSQLDLACGRLKMTQKGIEASVSDSLHTQAGRSLKAFEQSMEELAGQAVSRWRVSLARDLSSVARILGDEVRLEVVSGGDKKPTPVA